MIRGKHIDWFLLLALAMLVVLGRGWEGVPDVDSRVYMVAARNMLHSGDWLAPWYHGGYQIAHPPFIYWMTALSFKIFGVSIFAARIPQFLAMFGLLSVTYLFGKLIMDRYAALLSALILCTIHPLIEYAGRIRLDLTLSFFIALSALAIVLVHKRSSTRWYWLFGLGTGCAILSKGMPGLAPFPILVLSILLLRRLRDLRNLHLWGGVLLGAAIPAAWIAALAAYAPAWLDAHFNHEILGTGFGMNFNDVKRGILYFPRVLMISSIPWSLLALWELFVRFKKRLPERDWIVLFLWPMIILIGFSIPSYKIGYYILPAYPAVAILAGFRIRSLLPDKILEYSRGAGMFFVTAVAIFLSIAPISIHRDRGEEISSLFPGIEAMIIHRGVKELVIFGDDKMDFWEPVSMVELYFPRELDLKFFREKKELSDYFRMGKDRIAMVYERDFESIKGILPSLKVIGRGRGSYLVSNTTKELPPLMLRPGQLSPYP